MLRLDDVTKVYRVGTLGRTALRAVDEVSLDIGPGEVVSLIGESGSGKSTIGRMILRLASVTSGSITFDGTDVAALRGAALRRYYQDVQGVFQDPFSSYNPIFKVDRVFDMARAAFFAGIGGAEWETRLGDALGSVGLDPSQVLGKYPHQLSGGQLQRLLIARALLLDVRFLVADEVISMLDASTRIGVLNLLADLRERGLSILFITHDLSLGYYLSDRSVVLYRGQVVEMGDTTRVFDNPLHPYTRMLTESVPRLDARWADATHAPAASAVTGDGCGYYGRCPLGSSELGCDRKRPSLVEAEPGHLVACFAQ